MCDPRHLSRCGTATGCGTDGDAMLAPDACAGVWESASKHSVRSARQARRQGSRMSARTTPRLRCFRAGPGDICTLQDHLRHATEKRWRLEQTGIRQWNRNAVLMSKLLELDQDFTAQWTREPYSENAIGVPGINTPARRLWYLIPVSYCTVRYWYRYHNKFESHS